MSTTKNILMQEFNGTDYDFLFPETNAYTKEESLSAMVKKYLKLNDASTPSDAFLKLIFGVDTKLYQVKVIFPDGTPVSNINIGGLTALSGFNMVTDDSGQVIRKNTSANPTITAYTRFLDYKTTKVVAQAVEERITNVVITLEEQPLNEVLYLDSSISNCSVRRDVIKHIDWTVQCGGADGTSGGQGHSRGEDGGDGGFAGHALNVNISPQNIIQVNVPTRNEIQKDNAIIIDNNIYPISFISRGKGGKGGSVAQPTNNYNGTSSSNHIFNDASLPLCGGGAGGGRLNQSRWNNGVWSWSSGGQPNGGHGGITVWEWGTDDHIEYQGSAGKFPRGGGGGRANDRYGGIYVTGGLGAAGRVYYRLKTT